VDVTRQRGVEIGPHPHLGLHTVTGLLAGEVLHRDSLGSEQVIRPGQLNLMTAGHGIAHAEEATGRYAGPLHGVQLWVAQPAATREGGSGFEHHAELPRVELGRGTGGDIATVLLGELAGAVSPARRDSELVGADLELRSEAVAIPLRLDFEHALVVLDGRVGVDGASVETGQIAYLGTGRDEVAVSDQAGGSRALLIGGIPFEEKLVMWWNFVARSPAELTAAQHDWMAADPRFGTVDSRLERIPVGPPPWVGAPPPA
jgi:redox-sensitive bicupin YhaK (pirin superfamily)